MADSGIPAIDQRIVTLRETLPELLNVYRAAMGVDRANVAWQEIIDTCKLIRALGGKIDFPTNHQSQ